MNTGEAATTQLQRPIRSPSPTQSSSTESDDFQIEIVSNTASTTTNSSGSATDDNRPWEKVKYKKANSYRRAKRKEEEMQADDDALLYSRQVRIGCK